MQDFEPGRPETPPTPASTGETTPPAHDNLPSAAPVPATTTPPANRRNRVPLLVFGVALALLLVLGTLLAVRARANTPADTTDPTTILNSAKSAKIKDATYSLQGDVSLAFGANSTTSQFPTKSSITGTGKFTTATPMHHDITLSVGLLPNAQAEVLTDGQDIYFKASGLLGAAAGTNADKWYRIKGNGKLQQSGKFQDMYDNLQNVKYIGSEKINGKDTWHLRGDLKINGTTNDATATSIEATATAIATSTGLNVTTSATEDLWIIKDNSYPAQISPHATVNAVIPGSLLSGLPTGKATTPNTTPTPGTAAPTNITVTLDSTLQFTAWDSGITISAPPPDQVVDFQLPTGSGK